MAESIKPQTVMSAEELLRTEVIVNQALIDILIAKRIISEEELLDTIRKIKLEQQEKIIYQSNRIVSLKR